MRMLSGLGGVFCHNNTWITQDQAGNFADPEERNGLQRNCHSTIAGSGLNIALNQKRLVFENHPLEVHVPLQQKVI